MKNTFRFFALAAVVAAFASCDKIQNEVPTVKKGRTISLTVGTETKTILKTGGVIYWLSSDSLSVFDNTATRFPFKFTGDSNKSSEATFVCSNYTGSTPVYAVHFDRNTIKNASYDGTKVITGQVKAAQNIMNKVSFGKDASFSVGKIVQNGDNYSVETMKNCFSLIKFQLGAADIDVISVKGLNNEILAGWVDVDCDKLAADQPGWWTANTTKGAATEITLTVSGSGATNGHFAANSSYYIAVLPQTLSGLEITLTKSNGGTATRTINSPIVLNRSQIKSFEATLDQGLTFSNDIILNLTDASEFWYKDSNNVEHEGLPMRSNKLNYAFDFWNPRYKDGKGNPYLFHGNVYQWNSSVTCLCMQSRTPVQLPTIAGYTLKEVELTYQYSTSNNPTYYITDNSDYTSDEDLTAHALGHVNGITRTTGGSINLTGVSSSTDDRYLISKGEGNVKMILTYQEK